MNGYELNIKAYENILAEKRPDTDVEYIKAQIRSLEPFAERTEEERIQLFDSGAFNEVVKSYCRVAMKNCNVDEDTISNVINEIKWLFDTVSANEILKR